MNVFENPFSMGYIGPDFAFPPGDSPLVENGSQLLDDVLTVDNTGALVPKQVSSRVVYPTYVQNDTTTYADVPDLTVTINRVGHITFAYWVLYVSSDASEGIGLRLDYTGLSSNVAYSIVAYSNPDSLASLVTATSFGSNVAPNTVGTGAAISLARIEGSAFLSTVGDLKLQFRAETGSPNYVRVRNNSWARVWAS